MYILYCMNLLTLLFSKVNFIIIFGNVSQIIIFLSSFLPSFFPFVLPAFFSVFLHFFLPSFSLMFPLLPLPLFSPPPHSSSFSYSPFPPLPPFSPFPFIFGIKYVEPLHWAISSNFFFLFYFRAQVSGSHQVAKAKLTLMTIQPQSPTVLRLQVCITTPASPASYHRETQGSVWVVVFFYLKILILSLKFSLFIRV